MIPHTLVLKPGLVIHRIYNIYNGYWVWGRPSADAGQDGWGAVVRSFPRAMLIRAGSCGLWRAGLISNARFAVGVAVVVLVLLGGTTAGAS
jgi:hypothetical protein